MSVWGLPVPANQRWLTLTEPAKRPVAAAAPWVQAGGGSSYRPPYAGEDERRPGEQVGDDDVEDDESDDDPAVEAEDFAVCERDGSCTVAFVLETSLVVGACGPSGKSWR